MSKRPWLRLDSTFWVDAKVRKARAAAVWPWVLGTLKRTDGFADDDDLDPELAAMDLDLDPGFVRERLERIKRVGLLFRGEADVNVGGRGGGAIRTLRGWTTPNWEDYQPDDRLARREVRRIGTETSTVDVSSEETSTVDVSSGETSTVYVVTTETDPGTGRDGTGRDGTNADAKASVVEKSGDFPDDKSTSQPDTEQQVAEVLTYWQVKTNRDKRCTRKSTGAGKSRYGHIRARLREGYTADELRAAVDACCASAWHAGENPNGRRYDDCEHIFASSKIEKWLDGRKTEGNSPQPQPASAWREFEPLPPREEITEEERARRVAILTEVGEELA